MRFMNSPLEDGKLEMFSELDLSLHGEVRVQPPDGELDARFFLSRGQIDQLYQKHSVSMQRKGLEPSKSSVFFSKPPSLACTTPQFALVQSAVFFSKL